MKVDGPVDYDTYGQSDRQTQIGLFNAITSENRALLVRTHITRWVAANSSVLNDEQLDAVKAVLEVITADLYRDGLAEEQRRGATDGVMRRLEEVFTREQIWRGFVAGAPYIPSGGSTMKA